MVQRRFPTYFVSHGGGPWPWLKAEGDATYDKLEASLQAIPRELEHVPRAVLMISGHWEADRFLVSSSAHPPMVFDYYGFPAHTYQIRYDAPGDPGLAEQVVGLLERGGLRAAMDPQRGFDHGTFTVMHTMYPEANMPLIQLSLKTGYDPAEHLAVGDLIAPLRDEGVLIVGSGLSYHDLRSMRNSRGAHASAVFDQWLTETLLETSPENRRKRLLGWSSAPAAREAHPREDHLIPLMVTAGAAESEAATRIYHQTDFLGKITVSSFRFGEYGTR